jgi:3-oxoacyl-[acyl-carrier-protein] synthase-3
MAFLKAFGSYVPGRVVTSEALAERVGCEAAWVREVSGIDERRFAADDEAVPDLGVRAAQDCLTRAGLQPGDVGLLIVSSGSSSRRFPGPAASVVHGLGIDGVPAIDVPMASTGALFGMHLAAELAGAHGNVLVVAAEKMSSVVMQEPLDKNVSILFGDGAGACLIGRDGGLGEIVGACLHSDGTYAEDLRLEFGRALEMNGRTVILQASRKIPAAIGQALALAEVPAAAVEVFLMHQANQNLIVRVAQALKVAPEKFYSNIARFGNTSSASMLIAASEWFAERRLSPGAPAVFAAFGAGFHWGALAVRGT